MEAFTVNRKILCLLLVSMWIISLVLPASSKDIERVNIKELKKMTDSGAEVVIVDNRPQGEFAKQHVKNAISIPWDMDVSKDAAQKLPKDKDKLIITYCDCGPGEADSNDVANQLTEAGYRNVKTLADGWSAWIEAGYPVEGSKNK
jgi:rhodanese-related sulfurtransferase